MTRGGVVLVLAALLAMVPGVSQAHPWGPYPGDYTVGENVQFASNAEHVFCYNQMTALSVEMAEDARLGALGGPTAMTTDRDCVGGRVDVWVSDSYYGTGVGWRGVYSCRLLTGAGTCGLADVYINLTFVEPEGQRRKTLCHEFGHSVGLRHDTNTGCMQTGSSTARDYTQHEIDDHINSRYG